MSYKDTIRKNSDNFAKERGKWINRNSYFYKDDINYMKFLIAKDARVVELGCGNGNLLNALSPSYGVGVDISHEMITVAENLYPDLKFIQGDVEDPKLISSLDGPFDYIVLSDILGYLNDIEGLFDLLHHISNTDTRIVIAYHSWRWEPILKLGERLKLKMPSVEMNWLSTDDTINFLNLSDFELVKEEWRQLIPRSMFGFGSIINNYIGPLPIVRRLALRNYLVARPVRDIKAKNLSTTVLIPCRNEKGNVENAIKRMPQFCDDLEIIYVEGNSNDGTFQEINKLIDKYPEKDIKVFVQEGKGKGDAVRKGFENARGDILMILDADLTVPPEDLPKFYKAISNGKGEFINGTRLIYPMDDKAMRFLNFWANRTFSTIFTWLLNQRLTDTLCGTKVLTKKNYDRIVKNRSYFGDFDPFGDFDLIFGSSKLNLKMIEVPIRYAERKYGETQISRFRHGLLLLKMVIFAYKKLKIGLR
jgi:SAM-dependent methyltransferase